ncbi:hypothetical protein BJY01DRAFT_248674, partial [Aspergillus pseudoustus]
MSMWTAHGALDIAAQMRPRSLVLIHRAASSVGVWSIILAKDISSTVVATTRKKDAILKLAPEGFDTWFEIVGPENINALALPSTARHVTVVHAGILSINMSMEGFSATEMGAVQKLTFYTTVPDDYDEGDADFVQRIIDKVERGVIKPEASIDQVFSLQHIGEAHYFSRWLQ